MNPKLKRNTLRFGSSALKYLAIFAIFFFLLFPVYWMLTTSLKTNIESYRAIPTLWPDETDAENRTAGKS